MTRFRTFAPRRSPPDYSRRSTGITFVAGIFAAFVGAAQLLLPLLMEPYSALGEDVPAQAIAAQYLFLGLILIVSCISRLRLLTEFAAEFLTLVSFITLALIFLNEGRTPALLVHGAVGVLALASSILTRLAEKAEHSRSFH